MRLTLKALMLSPLLLMAGPVAADEVFLLNGDRLTGKIVSATGGKLILTTDAAGDITIDLAKVKTFSAEAPVQLQLGGKTLVESRVAAGREGEVQTEIPPGTPAQPLAIKGITAINPPLRRGTAPSRSTRCSPRGTPRPSSSASRQARPSAGTTIDSRCAQSTHMGGRRIRTTE